MEKDYLSGRQLALAGLMTVLGFLGGVFYGSTGRRDAWVERERMLIDTLEKSVNQAMEATNQTKKVVDNAEVLLRIINPPDKSENLESIVSEFSPLSAERALKRNNVSLIDEFDIQSMRSIGFVVSKYEEAVGNLSEYNIKIGVHAGDSKEYGCYDDNSKTLRVLPKLECEKAMLSESNIRGEGINQKSFERVVAHELGHNLSYAEGFGVSIQDQSLLFRRQGKILPGSEPPAEHEDFVKKWSEIGRIINERARKPIYDSAKECFTEQRPEGFPSLYSYPNRSGYVLNLEGIPAPGNGQEVFADTAVYVVLDQKYAEHDHLFWMRTQLVREKLKEIKESKK